MTLIGGAENWCPVCDGPLRGLRHEWLQRCANCGFLCSHLQPSLNVGEGLEEPLREQALRSIRQHNFGIVLDIIQSICPRGTLLDVGCGHGWFLQAAAARGYRGLGIEPDHKIAALAHALCDEVRVGTFPDALRDGETFDAITFNDVLEHLPRVDRALADANARLRNGGLLVVNLPLSSGILYRLADLLDRLGLHAPFARMWQMNFPSPHLSYFNCEQLIGLAKRQGLRHVKTAFLPSLHWNGLWQRLRYDRSQGAFGAAILFVLLTFVIPVLRVLPHDIGVLIFAADHDDARGAR